MIRNSLAALFALSLSVSAAEWRYWTWPGQARMAASIGRTAWFATSGGVFEWNLDANTSKIYQRNDGLPSTNLVSIAAQKDGSVWTASADGNLAVKRPYSSTWESKGTYSAQPSPWSFTPRAMVMHHNAKTGRDVLVMGGLNGLTFFPADSGVTLDWTDQFGSIGKREVRAITMLDDTLWIGLMGGLVRITPPWDSLGNNRAFVSDPKRWTLLASTELTDDYSALFPATGAMTWQSAFTFGAPTILLNNDVVYWNGTAYVNMPTVDLYSSSIISAVHALDIGSELLVSSTNTTFNGLSKGPFLIQKDGTFRTPPLPSNTFPTEPPPTAILESGMRITAWSNNHIFRWSRNQTSWSSPWAGAFSDTIDFTHNFNLTDNIDMNTFVRGSNGSIWAGTWGKGLWGALPDPNRSNDTLTWKRWSKDNSCLEETSPSYPGFVTINSLTATDSAIWGVTYRLAADSAILFSTTLDGQASLHCWKFPSPDTRNSGLVVGTKRIWMATHLGLRVFERPTTNTTSAKILYTRQGEFRRVLPITVNGQSLVLALTPSNIVALSPDATRDTVLANSSTQSSPVTARQDWKSMVIDGIGQIWLSGNDGLDILALVETAEGFVFEKKQELTYKDGLPSNMVYGISIDASTGNVLVTTDKGMGLWSSPYRPLPSSLDTKKARVYPNPLRTRTHTELVVDGATEGAHFYLHAADGSLVVHLAPESQSGGYFHWTLPGTSKLRPGVYRWTLKDGSSKVGGPLLIAE